MAVKYMKSSVMKPIERVKNRYISWTDNFKWHHDLYCLNPKEPCYNKRKFVRYRYDLYTKYLFRRLFNIKINFERLVHKDNVLNYKQSKM